MIHPAISDQGMLSRPPLSGWLARMSVTMARSLVAWSATGSVPGGGERIAASADMWRIPGG